MQDLALSFVHRELELKVRHRDFCCWSASVDAEVEVSAGQDRHIDLLRSAGEYYQYMVVLEVQFLAVVHCHMVLMEVSVDYLAVQDLLVLVQNQ